MLPDLVQRVSIALGLLLFADGCASVEPSANSRGVASKPALMMLKAVEGRTGELDAFEGLLAQAGLESPDERPPRERPLDREGSTRLLTMLLEKPLPLRSFPQRMGACFLLREVMERGGEVPRGEMNRRVERFRHVVALRPDGYLAWVLDGRTQQRAGPGQIEFKDGVFKANGFVLGRFYSGLWGAYRPVDSQMRPLPGTPPMGEVYDDADLFGRVMDGAEESFFALAMALGKFLSRPLDGIAELRNLPAGVAALITSSPEYFERFKLMTAGEQIQAVSRLTTTLITAFAGGGAVSAGLTRGLGGMEVAGLSLSAQGTLTLSRVVIPAGAAATVLTTGAGATIVLHSSTGPDQPAAGGGTVGSERAGKSFTPKGKAEIDAENAARHGGANVCENCGASVVPGQRSGKGVSPPGNERQRDHIIPKSKGGAGEPSNGQVLCRDCNIQKGAKVP